MSKLHLILAFHNHQPVGNFEHVLEECYRKSYLPFLSTLLDHPGLTVVLHYSGHLFTWMQQRHPEALDIIRTLVNSGRAEILSGGFYEPIISILPERDRVTQITEYSKYIKRHLSCKPRGMWLAERVWEPQMPKYIAKAGIEYLPIDDYHFKLTGLDDAGLLGYYLTEDEGRSIAVFPGSERLRYLIPFGTVDEIMSYLRDIYLLGGDPVITMADDGEKFGVWPNTYKHCYEDLWLQDFFTAIEHADWIETTTFSECRDRFQPLGRIYLPTASYREMGEWALPSEKGLEYEFALEELKKIVGEKAKALLRGSIWRSFLVKYPEANHLQKRMSLISGKAHEACRADAKKGRLILEDLWKGQCNDAYWHGIFGGLYLPHLRSSLYRHLLRAEAAAASVLKGLPRVERFDFDCDGHDDIMVTTRHLGLVVTEKGGCMTELSLYRQAVNVCDIISRRPEAYHAKIAQLPDDAHAATRTIHDQMSVKEEGLSRYLVYDEYRRASLMDHFLPEGTGVGDLLRSEYEELGDFMDGVYELDLRRKRDAVVVSLSREGRVGQGGMRIEKSIETSREPAVSIGYLLDGSYSGLFGVEMNLSFLGSPHVLIRAGKKTMPARSMGVHEQVRRFGIEDGFLGLVMDFRFSEEISLWHYPVETVSLSEQGIERLYQGTAFLFVMPVALQGKRKFGFTISFGEDKE
ncbi:MAG: DUF1926 domain-containing protein [Nitrospiraceae bacterium]|nr:DUF1926 domain-containing protein [Nitrospiraceae bacterium]